jgi:neurotransmitter:Na+ symporter, NSS family
MLIFGIRSALSGGTKFFGSAWKYYFRRNWFDRFDYLATHWLLPLGGLEFAIFVGWFVPDEARGEEFGRGASRSWHYAVWLLFLRYLAPGAMIHLFLFSIGVIPRDG